VLGHHDPQLLQHLTAGIVSSSSSANNTNTFELCVWPMLHSLLTELLPKHEWMRVFDHVFSNDAPFLAYLVLAYLVYFRAALLRVTTVEDLQFFLHHQACRRTASVAVWTICHLPTIFILSSYEYYLSLRFLCFLCIIFAFIFQLAHIFLISSIHLLFACIHHHPCASTPTHPSTRQQNALNISDLLLLAYKIQHETPAGLSLPVDAWLPMPPAPVYPIFNYYPKFVVDFQLKERERIADEERQVGERRQVMEELQRRSDALLAEQQAWAAKQVCE
jgi:hypothetical protein